MIANQKTGIITVLYNGKNVLHGFFESLSRQTFKNYILYVIDNSPNDEAIEEAKRLADYHKIPVEFIKNDDNYGVAKGNNQGIQKALTANCEYILLLNNDTEFENELIEKLFIGINESLCDMITPKIFYYDDPKKIWCAGGEFRKLYGFHTKHFGEGETDNGQFGEIKKIDYAPTCCMLIKKSVFDEIGYMDEKYFVYSDDADFCFRALKKNLVLIFLPNAHLWHKVSTSTGGRQSDFSTFYANRNLIYFSKKHSNIFLLSYILIFYQIKYLSKLILNKFSFKQFRIAQIAYFNGIRTNSEKS